MKQPSKILLLCLILALFFSACSVPMQNITTQTNESPAPSQENTSDVENAPPVATSVSVMLPNSHQALGQILQTIANSQNISLEIRLSSNEPRYTLELLEALESDDRPGLYWLPGEFTARALDSSSYYPYNLGASASGVLPQSIASMVPTDFRLLDDDKIYALPVGAYAQGTLVNLPLLAALLGTDDLISLQRDLILCNYEEWQVLQQAVADYLQTPGRYQFTLGGNLYTMPSYRPTQAETLRGIWALATVGDTSYAQNGLGTAFASVYADPADYLDSDPTLLNEFMQLPLETLYNEIEFATQHMVGHDGNLARGESFSLAREVTQEEAQQFFENGSALFWKSDSRQALQIEEENADLTQSLFLIPTKLPFEDNDVAGINQLYSLKIDGYLATVNAKETSGAAGQLLVQLFTEESSLQALQTDLYLLPYTEYYPQSHVLRSLEESVGIGEYYLMPIEPSSLYTTQQRIGDWINLYLMDSAEWTEEDKASFLTAIQSMWGEIVIEPETEEDDDATDT